MRIYADSEGVTARLDGSGLGIVSALMPEKGNKSDQAENLF
jgi:hypothetical protein